MTCNKCGMPAQGQLCKECERMERQEGRGTPAEIRERKQAQEADDQ